MQTFSHLYTCPKTTNKAIDIFVMEEFSKLVKLKTIFTHINLRDFEKRYILIFNFLFEM